MVSRRYVEEHQGSNLAERNAWSLPGYSQRPFEVLFSFVSSVVGRAGCQTPPKRHVKVRHRFPQCMCARTKPRMYRAVTASRQLRYFKALAVLPRD